ncbi:SGNH/GDSL hydrolase family protein [Winogradskyella sp.]|uniref:SGNH/GDSL hydrolase family protein n=1 Tax=Winogradskyella sp. TaxID=1883156 RepID=UPI003BADB21F
MLERITYSDKTAGSSNQSEAVFFDADANELKDKTNAAMDKIEEVENNLISSANPFYNSHTSLAALQAAHPIGELNAWAFIDAGAGITPQIARWDTTESVWELTGGSEFIIFENSLTNFPPQGDSTKIYVALDTYFAYVYQNNSYQRLNPQSQDWQQKRIKVLTTDTGIDPSNAAQGTVILFYSGADVTHIIFDPQFSKIMEKASELSTTNSFSLNILNVNDNTNLRADITSYELVNNNSNLKIGVSGILTTEVAEADTLQFELPDNSSPGQGGSQNFQQVTDGAGNNVTTNSIAVGEKMTVGDGSKGYVDFNTAGNGSIGTNGGRLSVYHDNEIEFFAPSVQKNNKEIVSNGGNWDLATNTPALSNSDTDQKDVEYIVVGSGSFNFGAGAIPLVDGDIIRNDGSIWSKKVNNNQTITSDLKGPLAISETPTEDGYYFAIESGAYVNAGNLTVDLSNGLSIIVKQGASYSLIEYPVTLTPIGTIQPLESNAISGNKIFNSLLGKADILTGKNIINKDDLIDNTFISLSTGNEVTSASYKATPFIRAKALTQYATSGTGQMAFYNQNRQYISGTSPNNDTFTTPANTYFIRQSFTNAEAVDPQTEEGTERTIIEEYYTSIPYLKSPQDTLDEIENLAFRSPKKVIEPLLNPLVRTNIKLIGDSIVAGQGGTGWNTNGENIYGAVNANDGSSTCWANSFTEYVDEKYNGVKHAIGLDNSSINILEAFVYATYGTTAAYNFLNLNTNPILKLDFYGTSIDVIYSTSTFSGIIDVYIDDVFNSSIDSYSNPIQVNIKHSVTGLTEGTHKIELRNTNTRNPSSTGNRFYLTGFEVQKIARSKNFGISGINTSILYANRGSIIENDDDIVICQVGVNDRVLNTLVGLKTSLRLLKKYCDENGVSIIFSISNPLSVSGDSLSIKMASIANTIASVLTEMNLDYINNYQYFLDYCRNKDVTIDSLLADGLHPNDTGYQVMYESIMSSLGLNRLVDGLSY